MALSTFTLPCNHHRHPSLELFSSCKMKTLHPWHANSPSPLSPDPGDRRPPFCLYNVTLRTAYKWHHSVSVSSWAAVSLGMTSSGFILIVAWVACCLEVSIPHWWTLGSLRHCRYCDYRYSEHGCTLSVMYFSICIFHNFLLNLWTKIDIFLQKRMRSRCPIALVKWRNAS